MAANLYISKTFTIADDEEVLSEKVEKKVKVHYHSIGKWNKIYNHISNICQHHQD